MNDSGPRSFSGERLREARLEGQMTIGGLADRLGVSRQLVSKYEAGQLAPPPETAIRIAQVLQLPLAYFHRAPSPRSEAPIFNRSLASTTKGARTRAEIRLGWLRRVAAVVDDHVELPAPAIPRLDVPVDPNELSDDRIEELAEATRRSWGLGNGPIANMVRLLESKGAIVSRFNLLASDLDAFCQSVPSEFAYVVLNAETTSCVRGRHNAAHELGHLVLHSNLPAEEVRSPVRLKQIEQQANLFASAFLMPADAFADDVRSVTLDSLCRLKPLWMTSIQSMLVRATQLGLVSEGRVTQLWRNLSRRGWRRLEPLDDELPVEEPLVLRQALALILEEEIESRDSLLERVALSGDVVEELTALPRGTLSRSLELRVRSKAEDAEKAGAVVKFPHGVVRSYHPSMPAPRTPPPLPPMCAN